MKVTSEQYVQELRTGLSSWAPTKKVIQLAQPGFLVPQTIY